MKNEHLYFFIICMIITTDSYAKNAPYNKDDLVSVVVLYRHGDRSPQQSYPNDPYMDKKYWPNGIGQMLNKGKMRHFELGKWFRARYGDFLSENYTPDDIIVMSSDTDPCHMSAQANLAGLYRPTGESVWNEDLLWEPIPIHSQKKEDDYFLAMSKDCPKYNRLYNEVNNSEYFKHFLVEYADMIQYIEEKTNWNISSIDTIKLLYSVFNVYQNHNASYIPSWTHSLDQTNFTYLAGVSYIKETFTNDLKRLHAGLFFDTIVDYFKEEQNSDFPKFFMLSAHDTTIASVLNSINAYDFVPPEFASTILWELRKRQNGVFYVNMFYKKPSSADLKEIILPGCDFNCNYDNFKNILSSVAIDEASWLQECNS